MQTINRAATEMYEPGNCSPGDLHSYTFDLDPNWVSHPIRMAATETTIYDMNTGKVIARVEPGYEFYWCHHHPHVCPKGWKGDLPDAK